MYDRHENADNKNVAYKSRKARKYMHTHTHTDSLHMMTQPLSQEKTTDRLPIH